VASTFCTIPYGAGVFHSRPNSYRGKAVIITNTTQKNMPKNSSKNITKYYTLAAGRLEEQFLKND
jgi:hypothetical protein